MEEEENSSVLYESPAGAPPPCPPPAAYLPDGDSRCLCAAGCPVGLDGGHVALALPIASVSEYVHAHLTVSKMRHMYIVCGVLYIICRQQRSSPGVGIGAARAMSIDTPIVSIGEYTECHQPFGMYTDSPTYFQFMYTPSS
jgi:hypothetical protein